MSELADEADSKSVASDSVRVRGSLPTPTSTEVNIVSVTQISDHFKTIFYLLFYIRGRQSIDVCVIDLYGEIYEVKTMTQRTCNIIKACKKPQKYKTDNEVEAVRRYMSIKCNCPREYYTDGIIKNIMLEAMYDYIDTCDCPSSFLREMNTLYNVDKLDIATRIARTFVLVQVKADKGKEWANGFYEELWNDQTDEILVEADGKYLNVIIDTSSTGEDLRNGDKYIVKCDPKPNKRLFTCFNVNLDDGWVFSYEGESVYSLGVCRKVLFINGERV